MRSRHKLAVLARVRTLTLSRLVCTSDDFGKLMTMNFVLKMMNFVLKTRKFVFKMMNSAEIAKMKALWQKEWEPVLAVRFLLKTTISC